METEKDILFSECTITYFDEDPDGEPDRAGDGYYYQLPGEEGWSGPWHSEDEAEDELRDDVANKESQAIEDLMLNEGWTVSRYVEGDREQNPIHLNKIEDRWFEARFFGDCFTLEEKRPYSDPNSVIRISIKNDDVDEDVIYGANIGAAKSALEALKVALDIEVPAPKM